MSVIVDIFEYVLYCVFIIVDFGYFLLIELLIDISVDLVSFLVFIDNDFYINIYLFIGSIYRLS